VYSYTGSEAGSQYVQGTVLQPWLGYWFRALQPVRLTLRATGRAAQPLVNKTITRAQQEAVQRRSIESRGISDWRLQIAARQGDLLDTDNTIGVAPEAKDGFDHLYDNEKPPLPTSQAPSLYLALQGSDREGRATPFADDVRAAGSGAKVWEFSVEAGGSGDVTLFWPNVNRLPRGLQPVLVDLSTGRRISMRSGGASYRFAPGGRAQRRFRVEVKPPVSQPLAIVNVKQTRSKGGGYRFTFTTTQEADVQLEMQTLTGKTVKNFVTRSRASEESGISWDGRAANGASLPVGPYVLSLSARDSEGNRVQARMPVVILR
jgi:hypothetical protein